MKPALRYLIALVLLTSCTLTPSELRERGTRHTFVSSLPPHAAAGCLTRAAEEYRVFGSARLPVQRRDGKDIGTYEVVAQDTVYAGGTAFLAEVAPLAAGSNITTWVAPHVPRPNMGPDLMARCK